MYPFPPLTLADVHADLTNCWDDPGEIEDAIAERDRTTTAFQLVHIGQLEDELVRQRRGQDPLTASS
ncbi:MAG: hypothetical protein IT307_05135 [Chloroflexi bacterium]|nr:hypothetical protein [Chloroflexota bacterium]